MPHILPGNLGLNQWMGFAIRWGGNRLVVARIVENGIRILIPVSIGTGSGVGAYLGNELTQGTIHLEDGATATPLDLSEDELEQLSSDLVDRLETEVDEAENSGYEPDFNNFDFEPPDD